GRHGWISLGLANAAAAAVNGATPGACAALERLERRTETGQTSRGKEPTSVFNRPRVAATADRLTQRSFSLFCVSSRDGTARTSKSGPIARIFRKKCPFWWKPLRSGMRHHSRQLHGWTLAQDQHSRSASQASDGWTVGLLSPDCYAI